MPARLQLQNIDDGRIHRSDLERLAWGYPGSAVWTTIRKTSLVAFGVGSVLFAINHLDVVLRGQATREVWVKATVTYLVPFCTSNIGILVATRRSRRRA